MGLLLRDNDVALDVVFALLRLRITGVTLREMVDQMTNHPALAREARDALYAFARLLTVHVCAVVPRVDAAAESATPVSTGGIPSLEDAEAIARTVAAPGVTEARFCLRPELSASGCTAADVLAYFAEHAALWMPLRAAGIRAWHIVSCFPEHGQNAIRCEALRGAVYQEALRAIRAPDIISGGLPDSFDYFGAVVLAVEGYVDSISHTGVAISTFTAAVRAAVHPLTLPGTNVDDVVYFVRVSTMRRTGQMLMPRHETTYDSIVRHLSGTWKSAAVGREVESCWTPPFSVIVPRARDTA
jgi:hypothetical protein